MPVVANRSGNTATVTVTVNIADILADGGLSAAQKRAAALDRAWAEFRDAHAAAGQTDAEIDARATAAASEVTRLKALKPTGTL